MNAENSILHFISSIWICNNIMVLSFVSRLIDATMAVFQIEEQVSLKLVVNTETNKVLFAEASKDFVDILCSFLTYH